ncbi:extracellular solute-binding protein [Parvibaculum sp.]|uniref:extracellular solute-binding protein n=1 Tax=Parvibaculum sp. TaxID=2024848 RepID=UPI001B1FE751|nr:extracellular solute-binding protein [Parvibaculum sp.]MBO6669457.1 ABC transporter substrate-binding protein [Parvibaculum sp.]MBO6692630.1 ABC transporter substrate-binding protein [Parvibaculum sp.]MBO6715843.1 ABC transporter substrate-binding protein [Parvibaculum sp.]
MRRGAGRAYYLEWKRIAAVVGVAFDALLFTGDAGSAAESLYHVQASLEPAYPSVSIGRDPLYGQGFEHFPWVNPNAPKGCRMTEAARGSFDSLNTWIVKGRSPTPIHGALYDGLLVASPDEDMVSYGLIANRVEVFEEGRRVVFHIDPRAIFHDGEPIEASDVIFSAKTLRESGRPFYQLMLRDLEVSALDDKTVELRIPEGMEPTVILEFGEMPVIPEHYWRDRDFGATTLEPFLGNGPYRFARVDAGRRLILERVDDYWAKDLPVNKGRFNFDELAFEYFFDETGAFQAFLAGDIDKFVDMNAQRWETMYDTPAVREGRIKRFTVEAWWPLGMNGFFFNLREDRFSDIRMRKALALLFDFEWPNENMFHGTYRRTRSYFQNSEFAADTPPTEQEKALMEPWRSELPPEAFEMAWSPPATDGSGRDRENFRQALDLFAEAGWQYRDGKLRNEAGEVFRFRILTNSQSQEAVLMPFFNNAKRAGIDAGLEVIDNAAYEARLKERRFDIAYRFYIPPVVPGEEQLRMWGSGEADVSRQGEDNLIGLENPMVDSFARKLADARTLDEKRLYARLLDRSLQWGFYAIPSFYDPYAMGRVAYWDRFAMPEKRPKSGIGDESWWCKAAGR